MLSVPSQPIRLGLIGCGGIVKAKHLPALLSIPNRVSIVAISDLVAENMAEVADLLGDRSLPQYTHFQDMLAKAELDAVSIATPHHLHAQNVIEAATAGVAIVCEKPMATSLDEADAMLEAVQANGIAFSVVHNFLFTPTVQDALAMRKRGELGAVMWGRANSLFNKVNDLPASDWRHRQATGGGAINDTAYHEIYLLEALVGSPVRYVEGRIRTAYYPFDVDDLALLLFEHDDGVVSTVETSWCTPGMGANNLVEVHGTATSLRVMQRGRSLHRYRRTKRIWEDVESPEFDASTPEAQSWQGHANYFAAVSDALTQGGPMPVTAEQARHNLAIIAAARRASDERRAVAVDEMPRKGNP